MNVRAPDVLFRLVRTVAAAGLLAAFAAPDLEAQVFSDQSAAQGVVFTQALQPDVLHLGAGGGWGDFNGDGLLYIFIADRLGPNALFQNLGGDAGFVDRAADFGVADTAGEGTGALFGDYDNDGDADLYVLNRGNNVLSRNAGPTGVDDWVLTDVTTAVGVEGFGRSSNAAWGDMDQDGFLDLYVSNRNFSLSMPQPAGMRRDYLYHSVPGLLGDRAFQDWSVYCDLPAMANAAAHAVVFVDMELDGDLDIFVANERLVAGTPLVTGENFLWRNDGPDGLDGWLFTDVAADAGVDHQGAPIGIALGDYDNNGRFHLFTSGFGPNHLYQRQGPGVFLHVAVAAGIDRPILPGGFTEISWGMSLIDCNLDGYEDLYVACGKTPGSSGYANALFLNNGDVPNNTFTDVSATCGAVIDTSNRCAVKGDYDGDGDEDLLVVSLGDDAYLFRNEQVGGSYFAVDLVGTVSNRDAMGARVKITVKCMAASTQWRCVQSGSSTGGGQALRQTFGVTVAERIDRLDVIWPSGQTTTMSALAINQAVQVVEPCGAWVNLGGGTLGSNGLVNLLGAAQ
ncbi:MAG: hypothetical protein ACI9EF_000308 [Pseudohongiellaceae bacterium]|jgi:hypothetical protein